MSNFVFPEDKLAVAIIRQAAKDLRGPAGLRKDAQTFFASSWYADLMTLLDLPPEWRPILED